VRGDQLYVTHCLQRTASRDALVLKYAPPPLPTPNCYSSPPPIRYELPMDQRQPGLTPAEGPCRLALVTAPGRRAGAHSDGLSSRRHLRAKEQFLSHIAVYPP